MVRAREVRRHEKRINIHSTRRVDPISRSSVFYTLHSQSLEQIHTSIHLDSTSASSFQLSRFRLVYSTSPSLSPMHRIAWSYILMTSGQSGELQAKLTTHAQTASPSPRVVFTLTPTEFSLSNLRSSINSSSHQQPTLQVRESRWTAYL